MAPFMTGVAFDAGSILFDLSHGVSGAPFLRSLGAMTGVQDTSYTDLSTSFSGSLISV